MRVVTGGLVAVALVAPAPAAAAPSDFLGIWLRSNADFVCIDTSSSAPVSFALRAPDGQTIETVAGARPDTDDGACRAGSSAGAVGNQANFVSGYAPGAVLVATQGSLAVSFQLPLAAFRPDPTTGTSDLKARGLPANAPFSIGRVSLQADANGSFDGKAPTGGDALSVTTAISDSVGNEVPYDLALDPRRFRLRVAPGDDPRAFRLTGTSPLAGPAVVDLYASDGATLLDQTTVTTRIDEPLSSAGAFTVGPPPSAIVRVSQPGWFSTYVQAPAIQSAPNGFNIGLPNVPGEGGSATPTFAFSPPGTTYCPGFGTSTLSCAIGGQYLVPGDTAEAEAVNSVGDSFAVSVVVAGSTGSLDDGSYFHYGGVPDARGHMTFTNPANARRAKYREEGDAVASDGDGFVDASNFFFAHVVNGATVVSTGPAFGQTAPPTFTWNLQVIVAGNTISGTTYPNARVAVAARRGSVTDTFLLSADTTGAFSVTGGDLRTGDEIDVVAANPTNHDTTTSARLVGQLEPVITGFEDGQFVRGTIVPTITGAGISRIFWSGELAQFNAATPPFSWTFDTTSVDDNTFRVQAQALGAPSATDYIYLNVDNTKPEGSAGPPQTIAPGGTATFVTLARDDNSGLRSVVMTFGDGKKATQRGDDATGVFRHNYPRRRVYTARVTITDIAGNVTRATARVRVSGGLAPTVQGRLPASVARGRDASARIKATAAGYLTVQLLDLRGSVRSRRVLHFAKSGSKATLRLPTRHLARGRYLTVWHFVGANGWAGPVVARNLRIR